MHTTLQILLISDNLPVDCSFAGLDFLAFLASLLVVSNSLGLFQCTFCYLQSAEARI